MAGGRGGDFSAAVGGAGGTGYQGDPEGRGGNGSAINQNGSGGGGGGAGGGSGGNGGSSPGSGAGGQGGSGATPIDGVTTGQDGRGGESNTTGGGGGGGAHGFDGNTIVDAKYRGGNGGNGGNGSAVGNNGASLTGGAGGGGAGGYGVVVGNATTNNNTSTIFGGNGGQGGNGISSESGDGGDGGVGAFFAIQNANLTNSGQITGGDGGAGGSTLGGSTSRQGLRGLGGAGIVGTDLNIVNTGTIAGGTGRDGQADAITFTGGTNNRLTLNTALGVTNGGLSGGIGISGSLTLRTGSSDVTLSSVIHNVTTAGSITKTDAGTLTLAGVNTYTGATFINAGTLAVAGGSAIANTGIVGVGFNSTFAVNASETIGALAGTGVVTIASGQTLTTGGANQLYTFSGTITGAGALAKTGTGKDTLTQANFYLGGTTISNGILALSGAGTLGATTGIVNLTGGGLDLTTTTQTTGAFTQVGGSIQGGTLNATAFALQAGSQATTSVFGGTGASTKTGPGLYTLQGTNTYTGETTISAGTLALSGAGSIEQSSKVINNANFDVSQSATSGSIRSLGGTATGAIVTLGANTLVLTAAGDTFAGRITGTGGLTIVNGIETLTGENNYTGATTIGANATLRIGASGTTGSVAGNIVNNGALVFDRSNNLGFTNAISGGGTLEKLGVGVLTLSGTNSYSGATTVTAGTLLVTGSLAAGSAVTVGNSATLGGTGTVRGTVGVNSGGTLSGGTAGTVGTLATGSLILNGSATFHQDITSTTNADLINVTGAVTLAGTLNLDFAAGFTTSRGDSFVFINNDTIAGQQPDAVSGKFSAVEIGGLNAALSTSDTFSFNNHTYQIDYRAGDGNDVAIRDVTFVPGPTQPTNPTSPTTPTQPTGPSADALMKFGMIVTDPASLAGQVYGLYEALLNRAPDPLGLEGFTTALQNGASLTDVANALLASGERGGGVTDPAAFVQSLYQNLLHRPADASGLATFTNELANGVSPATVAVQLATSAEAQALLAPTFASGVFVPDASESSVARLYYGLLGRAPDAGGLAAFSNFIETSGGGAAGEMARLGRVAETIILSNEFMTGRPNSTDQAFINGLYSGALGRAPDAGGQALYLDQLAHGVSRATVALEIAQSPEAQIHLVGQIQEGALLIA